VKKISPFWFWLVLFAMGGAVVYMAATAK
jgi:hypothetical protein